MRSTKHRPGWRPQALVIGAMRTGQVQSRIRGSEPYPGLMELKWCTYRGLCSLLVATLVLNAATADLRVFKVAEWGTHSGLLMLGAVRLEDSLFLHSP